jgi:hypothetical protein
MDRMAPSITTSGAMPAASTRVDTQSLPQKGKK